MQIVKDNLDTLFYSCFGAKPRSITPLPQGGSDRRYFRLASETESVIGAYNPDVEENRTFIYLTQHFGGKDLPVPQVLAVSGNQEFYLLSDLGDTSLFDHIVNIDWEQEPQVELLKKTIALLVRFQIDGAVGLDFTKCYPKSEFDLQSVMWDFNYFKYSFLKPSGIKFNETKLDDDFLAFANLLLSQPTGYFHYRDFQSRNVMLIGDNPYFIDYQGGRRGPLLYDMASFLYQARAKFSEAIRDEMLLFYIDEVAKRIEIDKVKAQSVFPAFALFRVIQTLGAYGYRGFFQRRSHFLQSIPLAAANLKNLVDKTDRCGLSLQTLKPILVSIAEKYGETDEQTQPFDGLSVEVNSFSYRKGYPLEHPEHGGGFVFDCRALPNPGRLQEFKMLTGLEKPVVEFLENHSEIDDFFAEAFTLVRKSIDVYLKRGFKHLSVSFGCTGGQHRSVYMANRLAKELQPLDYVRVMLNHREQKGSNGEKTLRKER
jgi:aminoglycoside/choline kinase family phosphotransferase